MTRFPFIIAEMSGNHNKSIDNAYRLIDCAVNAGVSAVKMQTYTPDTMTLNEKKNQFFIEDKESLWNKRNLYDLFNDAYTPWEWHEPLFKYAKKKGITIFSSPFDETAVELLEDLNTPLYKIASFECIDIPLIKKVASTKKPMIISTGMATLVEIAEAVEAAKENGCEDLTLLKCTSTYPASPKDSNLVTLANMKDMFGCRVGISDHSLGIGVAVAAIALGAEVIEKHLTIDRSNGGVDSAFSLEPNEFGQLVNECKRAQESLGVIRYGPTSEEIKSRQRRRSLYITENVKKGEKLTKSNLRSIRPGYGIESKHYEILLGKMVNQDIKRGTAMSWNFIA